MYLHAKKKKKQWVSRQTQAGIGHRSPSGADMCRTGVGARSSAGADKGPDRRQSNHEWTDDQAGRRRLASTSDLHVRKNLRVDAAFVGLYYGEISSQRKHDGIWFSSIRSALLLAVVLCWTGHCVGSSVLLQQPVGLFCFLRVTRRKLQMPGTAKEGKSTIKTGGSSDCAGRTNRFGPATATCLGLPTPAQLVTKE